MRSSILILNYNGLKWLEGCFGTLADATASGGAHDVYLVDNGSTDGSIEFTEKRFPWVKVYRTSRNAYGHSYNEIVPKVETDTMLLLNNDVEVDRGFVEPLLEHLHQPDVFAVVAKVLLPDRVTSQGTRASGGFHRGLWWYNQLPDLDRVTTTFFVPNQCAYSRSKFLELGGFDENLWPLYHEDIDISYRAWRRGYRILYEPRSVIYHYGGQTRRQLGYDWHREIVTQNILLLQWKNFDDLRMQAEHLAWLPPRLARAAMKKDVPFLKGFQSALRRRKRVIELKRRDRALRTVSDRDAFARVMAGIEGDVRAAIA